MVLRSFRFITAYEASRRSLIAIPLVAIALGVAAGQAKSQDLPPTQPGPTLTTADVPSADPTALASGAQEKAFDHSYTPPESKIFTLEPQYISATEFARVLEKLLLRDDVHFVPDERTNRLLIVVSPSTDEEMDRLDKRLHEIKELVDVEATRPELSEQRLQDVASWEKMVRDLQLREKDLQRQLEAVSKANPQQRNANEMEELKRMEFDVQLARIRRMRSQLDLMEAQLYENAGVQRPTPELPAPSVPYATPPVPPIAPSVPSANPLDTGQAALPPVVPVPPTIASPPTGVAPTAPTAPDPGRQLRDGVFVPAWGLAGELLRLRESAPNMDLTPMYKELVQRLHVQRDGLVEQEQAMNEVRDAVLKQAQAGTATAVDVARVEAQIVPLRTSIRELEVQIKNLNEQSEAILQQKPTKEPPVVAR